MRILINILLAIFLTFDIFAQKADSIYQYIGYNGYINIESQKIDEFDELPLPIKEIASNFIFDRFGTYCSNINFVHAQIFSIDSVFKTETQNLRLQNVYVNPIPYYDLDYAFTDNSLGISQYWINFRMDKLGQVISCNFPYFGNNIKKINSIQKVKEFSDSIIISLDQHFEMEKYRIELNYNKGDDILVWQICYLQSSTDENQQEYHCLLINAHNNVLISELGMVELQNIDRINLDSCNCLVKDELVIENK
jgi:hypothetical protein